MDFFGPRGYFLLMAVLLLLLAIYAGWRMTQRAAPAVADTNAYAPLAPTSTPVAVELAQEYAQDVADELAKE